MYFEFDTQSLDMSLIALIFINN